MGSYNTITITERNGTTYNESVGWDFDEAAQMLLGKEGKNGSLIHSVSMKGLSTTIQGLKCPFTRTANYQGD
jgi:hypothetical protein|tara:strand:- start:101 stop:316 length:216 start_codon:yes stop_codon:yes gene_type:complete